MVLLFGVAPLVAGTYLVYACFLLKKVKSPVYSAQYRQNMTYFSYALLVLSFALLIFFIVKKDPLEVVVGTALCFTAVICLLLFRVSIGENGVFLKLRFHPWSEFRRYRWKKFIKKGFWVLYLYNEVNFELTHIAIPEAKVSRVDLILQNKVGLDYLERKS